MERNILTTPTLNYFPYSLISPEFLLNVDYYANQGYIVHIQNVRASYNR